MSGISNHFDAMTSIKAVIDGLSLSGLTGGTVLQEVAEFLDGQSNPFVSISPYGPEKTDDELNDRDGVYYGTLVCILGKRDLTSLEQRLGWRQAIRRNLNNVALPSLGQNYNLKVEMGNVVELRPALDQNIFASGFVVRAFFQEPRA